MSAPELLANGRRLTLPVLGALALAYAAVQLTMQAAAWIDGRTVDRDVWAEHLRLEDERYKRMLEQLRAIDAKLDRWTHETSVSPAPSSQHRR